MGTLLRARATLAFIGLLGLTLAASRVYVGRCEEAGQPTRGEGSVKSTPTTAIPAIDAAVPAKTETATFALG